MKPRFHRHRFIRQSLRGTFAVLCMASFIPGSSVSFGQAPAAPAPAQAPVTAPAFAAEQLDSLVAPIALYPDPLLSQTLVASTYPLEIIQLHQWLDRNKDLKDQALADALMKQPWDPSIQSMAAVPEVVRRLAENIQWTTDLGNAFLAQPADVMDAVQRMRVKAQGTGALVTNEQQIVKTETVQTEPVGTETAGTSEQVIVVQQAQPEVVYVPSYDPVVVYGAPAPYYPYPSYTYPGYVPGMALAWGTGFILGAAWGGGWGYNCGWGGGDVNINNTNNFTRNANNNIGSGNTIGSGNRGGGNNIGNSGKWQHRPEHRGGAPYGDRGTADRFGGRGPGQKPGGVGGVGGVGSRPGGVGGVGGAGNRPGGVGGVGGVGGAGTKPGGVGGVGGVGGAGNRPGGVGGVGGVGTKPGGVGGAGNRPGSVGGVGGAGSRPGAGTGATRPSTRPSTQPSSRPSSRPSTQPSSRSSSRPSSSSIGSRSVSPSSSRSALGGSSGSAARASSSRGSSSMGRSSGGGASRGSGASRGGGGGSRGGGGGGRR